VVAIVSEQTRPTNELLLAQARRGDASAFGLLIRESGHSHRRLAFRLLGDRQRMDDALQEAYVRAFRALPGFGGRAAFATWLYRIVYNACLDELRCGRARREVPLEKWRGGVAADGVDERLDLEAALAALPLDLRAVVLLVDAEGLSYDEAAEVIGVPAGTIGSRLNRARDALRAALSPEKGA
jgi:RNA polymerase sigma-70 factor (ECF subfamily)